jgi:hypothetical protein
MSIVNGPIAMSDPSRSTSRAFEVITPGSKSMGGGRIPAPGAS